MSTITGLYLLAQQVSDMKLGKISSGWLRSRENEFLITILLILP